MTLTTARPPDTTPPPFAGTVGRHRSLPTGRAVAGGFFVAVAVVCVFGAWLTATSRHGRPWVVAARTIPPGVRVSAGDLTTENLQLPSAGIADHAFNDPASVVGKVLTAPLSPGELVQSSDVAAGPQPTLRPVTISVAASDLSGLVVGSLLDVLVTDGNTATSPTVVVVAGARVLAIESGSASLLSGSTGAQVTVGVRNLEEVTDIVHAAHTGTVSVVAGAAGDTATPVASSSDPAAAATAAPTDGSGG